ncbi:eukaryotic translation initiation factor 2A [Coccinella septempunctata]|uniref:eukaryotic translation initiation factor 2A n=1 Tax=Coccinella septempunctata TaxID=41139 RepID=UPI001D097C3C|nr:eukaryotic translation initiation factor 2A [Coccinella septempunctata]
MSSPIPLTVRSSMGISALTGPPEFKALNGFNTVTSKNCRSIQFSPNGDILAYLNDSQCVLLDTTNWSTIATIQPCKANQMTFSPKGTFLLTWEPFAITKANPNGGPNLHIYETKTGKLIKSFEHKKQSNWQPQWSSDEKLLSRLINTDIVFYEDLNFDKIVTRLKCIKVRSYGLSPNPGTYFFICHSPGSPGQPSFGRLFKYPKLETQDAIASKSFFQADNVDYLWNSKGNNALLLTSTEVDKTGGSYYGKQGLHYIGLNGQTMMLTMSKEGPIYSVEWSPKNTEFCVIYGFMPPKATVFNLKCEPVFELGTGSFNSIYFNPQANILLLGGFGNLSGNIYTWDTLNWKQIGTCLAPDTTLLEWSPDGAHFLTATTSPRLRVNNGFKIWHFSGALLHEKPCVDEELYDVAWKKYPKYTFKEPSISEKVQGIESSQPQASKKAYVPPSLRNRPTNPKVQGEGEKAHKPGGDSGPSKAALKLKKKREAKKAKKVDEDEQKPSATVVSSVQINLSGDPEKDKKLKNLKKKLDAIEKLKEQQSQGKVLEINQLAKIKGEADLLKELEQLQV